MRFVSTFTPFGCYLALFIATTAPNEAAACDPCGMHSSVQVPGVMNTLRSAGLQDGAFTVGLQEQFNTFRITGDNDLRTTESDLELIKNLSVTQFTAAYNITSAWALQTNIPFVVRDYETFERYQKVRETESGIGDASILTTYSPYSYTSTDARFFIAGLAGLKLPTGDSGSLKRISSAETTNSTYDVQGRGLTLGSGSLDVPLGLVTYGRLGRATLFASAQYTIRTEGAADYRFADDVTWSAAPGWLFLLGEEENLTLSLVCSGENKGSDHIQGQLLPRTAANNVYLGPEIFYSVSNRIFVQLGVDLPVAIDVGGAVVEPETRSRASITWSFS